MQRVMYMIVVTQEASYGVVMSTTPPTELRAAAQIEEDCGRITWDRDTWWPCEMLPSDVPHTRQLDAPGLTFAPVFRASDNQLVAYLFRSAT